MRINNCPLCKSTEFVATGPEAPPIVATAGAARFVQTQYRIRECKGCGLLYRDETLTGDELARYYAELPASHWDFTGYFPTERAMLSRLQQLPAGSRILDFGCSSGRLLASLTNSYDCFGIEINPAAAEAAAKKGLCMIKLDDLPRLQPFDAIVLVDVFEHLTSPAILLRTLVASLTSNGQLLIVTGNGGSPMCRRHPAQFWYFRNLEHVAMLTRRSTDWIARQLQLHIEEWHRLSHYDLSVREQLVQRMQTWIYWQFRNRTLLARTLFRSLPFSRLRRADVAPVCSCTRDHVLVLLRRS